MNVCPMPGCQSTAGCQCNRGITYYPVATQPVTRAMPRCSSCGDRAEQWWNYCAMCGRHIGAG